MIAPIVEVPPVIPSLSRDSDQDAHPPTRARNLSTIAAAHHAHSNRFAHALPMEISQLAVTDFTHIAKLAGLAALLLCIAAHREPSKPSS
jgi:hypothetical protein